MIGESIAPALPEPPGGLVNCAPGKAIDDAGVAGVVLGEKPPELVERALLRDDLIEQVRAIIAAGEDPCGEPQLRDDVAARRAVRGRGKRQERHAGKALLQDREPLIFRAEVMTPLGDAMRLVDGEKGEAAAREQFQAARRRQPLGRHVQEVDHAVANRALDLAGFAE